MSDLRYRLERELDEELQRATWAVQSCKRLIERVPQNAAKVQARLDAGVFIAGAQKGQPLTAQRRKQLEQERDHWFKFRVKQIEALPGLETELARIQAKVRAARFSR